MMSQEKPICECDDWSCVKPLGIDWFEHSKQRRRGRLIANDCEGRIDQYPLPKVEHHEMYRLLLDMKP